MKNHKINKGKRNQQLILALTLSLLNILSPKALATSPTPTPTPLPVENPTSATTAIDPSQTTSAQDTLNQALNQQAVDTSAAAAQQKADQAAVQAAIQTHNDAAIIAAQTQLQEDQNAAQAQALLDQQNVNTAQSAVTPTTQATATLTANGVTLTNATDAQLAAQSNAATNYSQGSSSDTTLGTLAEITGISMMATGDPATVYAGNRLWNYGHDQLHNANQMTTLQQTATTNGSTLGSLSSPSPAPTSGASSTSGNDIAGTTISGSGVGSGSSSSITTPTSSGGASSLPDNAKVADALDQLQATTGITPDDFANSMANGDSPASIVANAPNNHGLTEDGLNAMIDKNDKQEDPLTTKDVMNKLGLSDSDLGISSGGGRRLASTGKAKDPNALSNYLDSLGSGKDKNKNGAATKAADANAKLSANVQAALDQNGITNRSIFDIVHSQYVKKMPMLKTNVISHASQAKDPLAGAAEVDLEKF